MIIEIKDIPNEQIIDKIDIHIDFQKQSCVVKTEPKIEPPKAVVLNDSYNRAESKIPDEMLNGDF